VAVWHHTVFGSGTYCHSTITTTNSWWLHDARPSAIASWGSGGVTSYGYHIAVSSDCKQVMAGAVWHGQWETVWLGSGSSMVWQLAPCSKWHQQLLQPMGDVLQCSGDGQQCWGSKCNNQMVAGTSRQCCMVTYGGWGGGGKSCVSGISSCIDCHSKLATGEINGDAMVTAAVASAWAIIAMQ